MRNFRFLALAVFLGLLIPSAAMAGPSADRIVITVPFAKIYSALDPDSSIIRMAAQNERFELDHAGQKWFRVRLDDGRMGFIPTRDAQIENGRRGVNGVIIFLGVVLLAVSAFFGLRGRKNRASAEV